MTNAQYGEILGMMWGAIPGSIGVWGILAGIQQGRIGPIIVGLVFCALGWFTYSIFHKAALKWLAKDKNDDQG